MTWWSFADDEAEHGPEDAPDGERYVKDAAHPYGGYYEPAGAPMRWPGRRTLSSRLVQRKALDEAAVNEAVPDYGDDGEPLDDEVRARVTGALGERPPDAIRVHRGPEAARAAVGKRARAFTTGTDIVLGAGESPRDVRLMAHEATHVVQQARGLGQAPAPGDAYEAEANRVAEAAASFEPAPGVYSPGKRTMTQLLPPRLGKPVQLTAAVGVAPNIFSDVGQWVYDNAPTPLDPLAPVFGLVVESNRVAASRFSVPDVYKEALRQYLNDTPSEAATLGLTRHLHPHFYSGGWILKLQPRAGAMTLDRDVFIDSGDLKVDVWIHELVHVAQYAYLGRTNFLTTYFGLSALTLAKRLIQRKPIDPMKNNPLEVQAYSVEERFRQWAQANRPDLHNPTYFDKL